MVDGLPRRTLREILNVIFSRLGAIAMIVLIITGGTALACLYSKKIYRSAVILWARQGRTANPLAAVPDPTRRLEVFLKTQREIILSDLVIRRTLTRMARADLADEPADPAAVGGSDPSRWQHWNGQVEKAARDVPQRQVREFRKQIEIATPGGEEIAQSEVFTISVDQPDPPEQAQMAASILTDEYPLRYRLLRASAEESSRKLLEQQLTSMRKSILGTAEEKLNSFITDKIKGDLVDIIQMFKGGTEVNHQTIRTAFQQELIKIDASLKEQQALAKEVTQQIPPKAMQQGTDAISRADLEGASIIVPLKVLSGNDIVNKMKKKLADLIIRRNSLQVQFTDDFATVKQTKEEIFKTKLAIIDELIAEVQAIAQRANTLKARRDEIQARVDEEDKTLIQLSGLFVQYKSLAEEVDLARKLCNDKRKDLLDADTARQMAQQEILITRLEDAVLPDVDKPVRPILSLYTLVAAIVALLIGTAYAFLADFYDHSMRSIYQVERYLGLPVLASVKQHGRRIIVSQKT